MLFAGGYAIMTMAFGRQKGERREVSWPDCKLSLQLFGIQDVRKEKGYASPGCQKEDLMKKCRNKIRYFQMPAPVRGHIVFYGEIAVSNILKGCM